MWKPGTNRTLFVSACLAAVASAAASAQAQDPLVKPVLGDLISGSI